jgi:neutral ceramidase
MPTLHAGIGRASLTPAIGNWLLGFAGRDSGCTSIHDELYATTLVLEAGGQRLAIVSCDLLFLHPRIVSQVREIVEATTGIPGRNVMLCCTHTHSGPPGFATEQSHPIDKAYVAHLPYRIAGAVRLACDNLTPARLGHANGKATIGINRRQVIGPGKTIIGENLEGPVDRTVGVLRVDNMDGKPLAVLVNYACHPVILGPPSLAVSADYIGQTRANVEAATGAPMLFIQGACGDINPLGGVRGADDTNCKKLGAILADEVCRIYATIDPQTTDLTLTAHCVELGLPLQPSPVSAKAEGGTWAPGNILDQRFPWAADMSEQGARMEVQAFALGDLALVSVAAEPFVETGLATKAALPFGGATFFAGYTNGCVGYVPTAQAIPLGGYEVQEAHIAYRMPAPFIPEAEQMVVRACVSALAQVRDVKKIV